MRRSGKRRVVQSRREPVKHSNARNPSVMKTALVLPGIGNSGPDHWQSLWEKSHSTFVRVGQRDWDNPICEEWLAVLEDYVMRLGPDVVLVAHSLACLLVARWAARTRRKVKGALLAAPPDPTGPRFPKEARGFSPVSTQRFPFPSIVVASTNDPYGSLDFARSCAATWGSRLVTVGALGHINGSSGIGGSHEGFSFFQELAAQQ